MSDAEIGVFGGSGFYSFLEQAKEVAVDTPYGPTSDRFVIGERAKLGSLDELSRLLRAGQP